MKLSRIQVDPDAGEGRMMLTPFVDMVFILLIFFIVTSVFIEEEKDLEVELPFAREAETLTASQRTLVINVRRDGTIIVNEKTMTLEELSRFLEEVRAGQQGRMVVIRGDRQVPLQKCVDVMDLLKKAGYPMFTIKTE
jgi:biopolymer transport protein ExbD